MNSEERILEPLRVENVTVVLNGQEVIKDVSFSIKKEGLYVVVGPNGGGKTTLVRTIMNLLKPARGSVYIFDQPNYEYLQRNVVGYLPQRSSFRRFFPIRVYDVVKMGLREAKNERDLIMTALEKVGMRQFSQVNFSTLSGGQQQRVLIARAIVSQPKLLVLDEPVTGLDYESQNEFYLLIKSFVEDGTTVLMVTHDVGFAMDFSDQIFCINRTFVCHISSQDKFSMDSFLVKLYGYGVKPLTHGHGEGE
jgi:zinc transport system ATP-binding protein